MPLPTTRDCAGACRRDRKTAQHRVRAAAIAIAALLVASAGCGGDGAGSAPPAPPPPSVEVITLAAEPFEQQADLLGELQAEDSVVLNAEVPGVIESIEFEDGQTVKTGDVLFRLRDREESARLREADAQLLLAGEDFKRTRTLADRNAAAAAQLDKARANLEVARARADRRRAELERMQIRAPFAGRVGARLVSPGARVKVDDGLVRLDGIDPLALVFTIPESVLPLARLGARFEMEVAAFPDRRFPGEIRFIAPSVDSATRRILIKGRVPNPDGALLPGMFARVTARLGEREAVLVPEDAIVTTSDGTFVWRIGAEDKAERVAIELGGRESGRVEVVSGVAAGDRIVTAGTHKVHAGAPVRPVTVAAPSESPPSPSAAAAPGGDA